MEIPAGRTETAGSEGGVGIERPVWTFTAARRSFIPTTALDVGLMAQDLVRFDLMPFCCADIASTTGADTAFSSERIAQEADLRCSGLRERLLGQNLEDQGCETRKGDVARGRSAMTTPNPRTLILVSGIEFPRYPIWSQHLEFR